jgi:hypothetical protein
VDGRDKPGHDENKNDLPRAVFHGMIKQIGTDKGFACAHFI